MPPSRLRPFERLFVTSSSPPSPPPRAAAGGGADPNPTYLPPWLGARPSGLLAFAATCLAKKSSLPAMDARYSGGRSSCTCGADCPRGILPLPPLLPQSSHPSFPPNPPLLPPPPRIFPRFPEELPRGRDPLLAERVTPALLSGGGSVNGLPSALSVCFLFLVGKGGEVFVSCC